MKKLLLVFATLTLVFSCKEEKKGPTPMEEVMAIHDEIMPKMGTIGKLASELEAKADTTEMGQKYKAAQMDLQQANMAMMDWMKGFGDKFTPQEIMKGKELTPEKEATLKEEEANIKAIADKVNGSIERAQKLLGESAE